MEYEKLKKLLIKDMNINEKTMHVLSMAEYVKRITVKEFFEGLENAIDTVNKDEKVIVKKCITCKNPTSHINVSYCDKCLLNDDYSN